MRYIVCVEEGRGTRDLKRSIKFCQFLWVRVVQLRANTGKAAMPKDCYFALHSSIEMRDEERSHFTTQTRL